jgi:hypothetical protein
MKRSPSRIAKWCIARYQAYAGGVIGGTWPRVVMIVRSCAGTLSRAFVVSITRRIAGGTAKGGMTCVPARRHAATTVRPVRPMAPLDFVEGRAPHVTDGLTGISEALAAVCPATTRQTGIVQLIRHSVAVGNWKERPHMAAVLRPIDTALSADVDQADVDQDVLAAAGLQVVKTVIQTIAPSVCAIQRPTMARDRSGRTPGPRETALLRTTAASRTVTRRASKQTTGDTDSRGRLCHAVTSATMAAVTALIRSGETSTAYAWFRHA